MSNLTPEESLNLKKLISNYDAEDNTQYIRSVKHSSKIRENITILETLKKKHETMRKNAYNEFVELAKEHAGFLYTNYSDIFHRILKDELDLEIMNKFLIILKMIEEERCSQHEGSVAIGKLLKEMYIDSALKAGEHLDKLANEQTDPEEKKENGREITWNQWTKKRAEIRDKLYN